MTEEYCEDCKGIEIESWVDGQLVIETGSKLCQYHGAMDKLLAERIRLLKGLVEMYKKDAAHPGFVFVGELCDEYLDKSGSLLGRIRNAVRDNAEVT